MSRTKRKKKTELEVYHRNQNSRFMSLIEKTDYIINIAYNYLTKHNNKQRKKLALYYKSILRNESQNKKKK